MRNLYTLAKKKHVVGIEGIKFKKDHLCGACEAGKMTRAKHPSKTIMTTSRPFELLHMDLFGPTHYSTLTSTACTTKKDTSVTFWAERIFFCHTYDTSMTIIVTKPGIIIDVVGSYFYDKKS